MLKHLNSAPKILNSRLESCKVNATLSLRAVWNGSERIKWLGKSFFAVSLTLIACGEVGQNPDGQNFSSSAESTTLSSTSVDALSSSSSVGGGGGGMSSSSKEVEYALFTNVKLEKCEAVGLTTECTEVGTAGYYTENGEPPTNGMQVFYVTTPSDTIWGTYVGGDISQGQACNGGASMNLPPYGQVIVSTPDLCNEQ